MDGSYFFAAERGKRGRLQRLSSLADESYAEFCEGARNFVLGTYFRSAVAPKAMEAAAKAGLPPAVPITDGEKVAAIIDQVPAAQLGKRLMRSQQQMTWRNVQQSFYRRKEELMAELDAAERAHPERLIYDKDFKVPAWASHEIHLQPSGYVDDPLGGYVYHYGTKVFFRGGNDQDDIHESSVAMVPVPKDGKVKRILDLGCSIGQFTTALKDRFPDAEVTGIDVGLPMVRYAHKRALDMGREVTFMQRLAEETGLPDAHFDIITAHIIFHEMPPEITKRVVAEAMRMLRPGGIFVVIDFPTKQVVPPLSAWFFDFDHRDNGEPHSIPFIMCNFAQMLKDAGFEVVDGPSPVFGFLETRFCTKPEAA